MRTLRFYKAMRLNDGQTKPESLTLIFLKPVPAPMRTGRGKDWEIAARARYIREGARIEDELHQVLPGGVYDQLFSQMCQRKAKLSVLSFALPKPETAKEKREWLKRNRAAVRKPQAKRKSRVAK